MDDRYTPKQRAFIELFLELKFDYAKTRDSALIQELVRDLGAEGKLIQTTLFWDSLWNCEWDLADALVDPLVICPEESWEVGPLHSVISGHQPSSDVIFLGRRSA